MDVKEQIALAILKGAGGDVDKDYTSTAEIYRDVESIYREQDNRQDVEPLQVELVDNGTYTYDDRNTQGYKPVEINVNVPVDDYYNSGFENGMEIQKSKLESITITENGNYTKEDGYDEVEVNIDTQSYYDNGYNNGTQDQKSKLESITITENGNYNREDGYNEVEVSIDTQSYYDNGYNNGYSEGDNKGYERGYDEGVDNGIQEQKSKLESITIESNGTYIKEDGYNEVKVALDIPKTKIYNGIKFNHGYDVYNDYKYFRDIDFGLYDWSSVYDVSGFFNSYTSNDGGGLVASDFDNFIQNYNGDMLSCSELFKDSDILELPNFGDMTKNCINMASLAESCDKLVDVSNIQYWNTSNVTNTSRMFYGCKALTTIPLLDTGNATNMEGMFMFCSSLTTIPSLDLSSVTNTNSMFYNCKALTTIPSLDLSSVTDAGSMFQGCESLTTIPSLDLSRVTNANSMFQGCVSLTTIPSLDLSSVTDAGYMFQGCVSLTTIPSLDLSRVTNAIYMFRNCAKLKHIESLNTSSLINASEMFSYTQSLEYLPLMDFGSVNNVTDIFGIFVFNQTPIKFMGGFKDLGKQRSVSGTNSKFLNVHTGLPHESLMNVINNLFDRKSVGYSNLTINIGPENLASLTDSEIAIATNKGYNLI